MRKNSIKYSRMNGEVQRELSKIISRDIKDPRIHPMTSVVSVDVTPDLKFAKVFVSVLGNDEDKEKTKKGLQVPHHYTFAPCQIIKPSQHAGAYIFYR